MRFAMLLAMMTCLLSGQEKAAPPKPDKSSYETAIIPVKTLTGDSFQRLASILHIFGEKYAADEKLRTIVVYAPRDVIAHMRKVVEAMDRPGSEAAIGRNIEMNLTYLLCPSKPVEGHQPVPADMEQVAKQLKAASLCKEVYLWDVLPLRLQEGKRTESKTRLPLPPGSAQAETSLRILPLNVIRKDTGRFVRFEEINLYIQYSGAMVNTSTSLVTAGEYKEGQKSVIGKTSASGIEGAVFAVIELKVLD
ncbi:MAG: hypothetical protein JNK48_29255 [Bryobacterales bacterium]|nr:hypothetical protein [Bryobacterales bacterium]